MYFYMTHGYLMDYACRRDVKFKYSFLISSTILCCHNFYSCMDLAKLKYTFLILSRYLCCHSSYYCMNLDKFKY